MPLGRTEADGQVFWVNMPEAGVINLAGDTEGCGLYTDGSGTQGPDGIRRAGWAVVQTNPAGEVLCAAYGPVPIELLPCGVARDGEDNAVLMAARLSVGRLVIRAGCEGTVRLINGPRQRATSEYEIRAHIWTQTFAAHPELSAVKVAAHATAWQVATGEVPAWERAGNGHADRLCKLGAKMHPTWLAGATMLGLGSIARQALSWATERQILETDADRRSFPEQFAGPAASRKKRGLNGNGDDGRSKIAAVRHRKQLRSARATPGQNDAALASPFADTDPADLDPRRYRGHSLGIADIEAPGELPGSLAFCHKRHAFFHCRAHLLAGPLQGARRY